MRRRAEQHLNEFWGLDPDINELRTANRFVRLGRSQRPAEGFSLGERSTLGRFIRDRLDLDTHGYAAFMDGFWDCLSDRGCSYASIRSRTTSSFSSTRHP